MKAEDLLSGATRWAPVPLTLLLGTEGYFADRVLTLIRETYLGGDTSGFRKVSGREGKEPVPVFRVLDELRSPSLFAARRLVAVLGAGPFLEQGQEPLLQWISNPNPDAALVLLLDKLPAKDRLKKHASVIECKPLYDKPPPWKPWLSPHETDLNRWTREMFRSAGVAVGAETAHALIERTGNDLGAIERAVQSLTLGAESGKPPSRDQIAGMVGTTRRDDVFDLLDTLLAGRTGMAAEKLSRILEAGLETSTGVVSEPTAIGQIMLVHMRTRFDRVRLVTEARKAGGAKEDLAKAAGVSPFLVDRLVGDATRFAEADWSRLWSDLLEADRELKSNRLSPETVLLRLLWKLGRAPSSASKSAGAAAPAPKARTR